MFLKNRNIISKIKRSKVTNYAALKEHIIIFQFETRQNLSKFEGSSSISSSDLFGDDRQKFRQSYGSNAPDLQDIKEGVRQGVTKVAGRISNIANGVMSSLQV